MSKSRMGAGARGFLAVLLLASLNGCQQVSNLVGKGDSKVALARKESKQSTSWSGDVESEQKLDVQLAMAQTYESQGNVDGAIRLYQSIASQNPKSPNAYHRLAVLYDKKGNTEESQKHYQKALKYGPKNADLHCDYGYSLYLQRRWDEAEKSFRQSLELNPSLARARVNLGLLLTRTGRGDAAADEFHRAGCSEAEIHSNLAFALVLDEKWEEAKSHYQIALAKDPKSKAAKEGLKALTAVASQQGPSAAAVAQSDSPSSRQVSHAESAGPMKSQR